MHSAFSSRLSLNRLLEVSLLIILVLPIDSPVFAQQTGLKDDYREEAGGFYLEWSEGSVVLSDGSRLLGKVKYNQNLGAVSFQNADDTRTLTAKVCVAFEFWDASEKQQRTFISLEYGDVATQMFFEVLFQFRLYAVLREGSMNLYYRRPQSTMIGTTYGLTPSIPYTPSVPTRNKFSYVQRWETFYLMSELGEIKPFVAHYFKDRAGDSMDKKTVKVLNEDFLLRLIGQTAYDDLAKFQKENALNFTREEDMMKIFAYYRERWSEL
jgi:hypothetical protein